MQSSAYAYLRVSSREKHKIEIDWCERINIDNRAFGEGH